MSSGTAGGDLLSAIKTVVLAPKYVGTAGTAGTGIPGIPGIHGPGGSRFPGCAIARLPGCQVITITANYLGGSYLGKLVEDKSQMLLSSTKLFLHLAARTCYSIR